MSKYPVVASLENILQISALVQAPRQDIFLRGYHRIFGQKLQIFGIYQSPIRQQVNPH